MRSKMHTPDCSVYSVVNDALVFVASLFCTSRIYTEGIVQVEILGIEGRWEPYQAKSRTFKTFVTKFTFCFCVPSFATSDFFVQLTMTPEECAANEHEGTIFCSPTENDSPGNSLQTRMCSNTKHIGDRAVPIDLFAAKAPDCRLCKCTSKWNFELPPLSIPCSGKEFIDFTVACKRLHFDKEGKGNITIDIELVSPSTFVNEDERANAASYISRTKLDFCGYKDHVGERHITVENDQRQSQGIKCRICVNLNVRTLNKAKATAKRVIYESAEDFIENVANKKAKKSDIIGHCRKPKKEEFNSFLVFEEAQHLMTTHNQQFKKEFYAQPEQKEMSKVAAAK